MNHPSDAMIVEGLLVAAGIYLLGGLLFAIPFLCVGVARIDSHAAHGSWGFRILILPGTMLLWPLLARRWLSGFHEPPEEKNPHRRAARSLDSPRMGAVRPAALEPSPRSVPVPPGTRGTNPCS